jgi:hypothetical protein
VLIELLKLMFHLIVIYILVNLKLISKNPFIESIIGHENHNKRDRCDNREKANILPLINLHPQNGNRIQKDISIHNLFSDKNT